MLSLSFNLNQLGLLYYTTSSLHLVWRQLKLWKSMAFNFKHETLNYQFERVVQAADRTRINLPNAINVRDIRVLRSPHLHLACTISFPPSSPHNKLGRRVIDFTLSSIWAQAFVPESNKFTICWLLMIQNILEERSLCKTPCMAYFRMPKLHNHPILENDFPLVPPYVHPYVLSYNFFTLCICPEFLTQPC